MGTREQVEETKNQIATMMAMRIKQRAMAKQLGLTKRRIQQLVKIIREERAIEVQKKSLSELLGDVLNEQDVRVRKLWGIVDDDEASFREKIMALSSLRAEREELIKTYQRIGIFPKDPVTYIEAQPGSVVAVADQVDVNVYERVLAINRAEDEALKVLEAEQQKRYGGNTESEEKGVEQQQKKTGIKIYYCILLRIILSQGLINNSSG